MRYVALRNASTSDLVVGEDVVVLLEQEDSEALHEYGCAVYRRMETANSVFVWAKLWADGSFVKLVFAKSDEAPATDGTWCETRAVDSQCPMQREIDRLNEETDENGNVPPVELRPVYTDNVFTIGPVEYETPGDVFSGSEQGYWDKVDERVRESMSPEGQLLGFEALDRVILKHEPLTDSFAVAKLPSLDLPDLLPNTSSSLPHLQDESAGAAYQAPAPTMREVLEHVGVTEETLVQALREMEAVESQTMIRAAVPAADLLQLDDVAPASRRQG